MLITQFIYAQEASWSRMNTGNSSLPNETVKCIVFDSEGAMWAGTYMGGLARLKGDVWTIYNTSNSELPHNYINSIAIDKNNVKWIGTDGGGLARFDGTSWQIFKTSNSGLPSNVVMSVYCENSGVLWIGTYFGGVARYDGQTWTVYNDENSPLLSNKIVTVTKDTKDVLWVGTQGGGLGSFDGKNWTIYTERNSKLTSDYIYSIAIDEENNKWVGTGGGGVAIFNDVYWITFNSGNSEIADDNIRPILINQGNKWIGTYIGGLNMFDGNAWKAFDYQNSSMPDDEITCLAYQHPNLMIGTERSGIIVFQDKLKPKVIKQMKEIAIEEKPIITIEEEPLVISEEKPFVVIEEEPLKVPEEKPLIVIEDEPLKVPEEIPEVILEEKPLVVAEEEPVIVPEEKPFVIVDEEPAVINEEQPPVVIDEKPLVVVEDDPVVAPDEKPLVVVEDEPEVVIEEKPLVVVEEEPEIVTGQEPITPIEEEIVVVEPEQDSIIQEEIPKLFDSKTRNKIVLMFDAADVYFDPSRLNLYRRSFKLLLKNRERVNDTYDVLILIYSSNYDLNPKKVQLSESDLRALKVKKVIYLDGETQFTEAVKKAFTTIEDEHNDIGNNHVIAATYKFFADDESARMVVKQYTDKYRIVFSLLAYETAAWKMEYKMKDIVPKGSGHYYSISHPSIKDNWSVTGQIGFSIFRGDFDVNSVITFPGEIGIAVNKQVLSTGILNGGIKAQFNFGQLKGSKNDYSFENHYKEGTINFQVILNRWIDRNFRFEKVRPYAFAGIGFINYRVLLRDPNGYVYNGYGYKVTEGDLEGNGTNPQKDKALTDLMIPLGIGANYKLNAKINLELEASSRFINSDKLDARVKNKNDKYWFVSVGITYILSNKEFLADILNR